MERKPWEVTRLQPGNFSVRCQVWFALMTLQHGIDLVNSGEYGLTSGLDRLGRKRTRIVEIDWSYKIYTSIVELQVPLYNVNRLARYERSVAGGGIKAGGPIMFLALWILMKKPFQQMPHKRMPLRDALLTPGSRFYESKIRPRRWKLPRKLGKKNFRWRTSYTRIRERNIFQLLSIEKYDFQGIAHDGLTMFQWWFSGLEIAKTNLTCKYQCFNDEKAEKTSVRRFYFVTQSDDEFVKKQWRILN